MSKKKSKLPIINWVAYEEAKIITGEDRLNLEKLNDVDERLNIVSNDVETYVDVFQKVLTSIRDNEVVVKYIMDILIVVFSRSKRFLRGYCSKGENCYESLLEHLETHNEVIMKLNYGLILRVLFRVNPTIVRVQIKKLLEITYRNIRRYLYDVNMTLVLTQCIMNVTKDRNNRRLFYSTGGLKYIIGVLQKYRTNIQLEYTCCFCVWTLSFEKKYQKVMFQNNEKVFAILHDVLIKQNKGKVKRIILLSLKNFVECPEVMRILTNIGVYPTLLSLKKKSYKDEDIPKLIGTLIEKFDVHISEISSFSEYRQEVLLGKLDWTPPHKSERFWKENMKNFEEDNYIMVRKLIQLISLGFRSSSETSSPSSTISSTGSVINKPLLLKKKAEEEDEEEDEYPDTDDSSEEDMDGDLGLGIKQLEELDVIYTKEELIKTVTIALFDLGQFIRFFPRGKKVITKHGGKKRILNLMAHKNEKIRNQAIMTTQKLLINKWDHMK